MTQAMNAISVQIQDQVGTVLERQIGDALSSSMGR